MKYFRHEIFAIYGNYCSPYLLEILLTTYMPYSSHNPSIIPWALPSLAELALDPYRGGGGVDKSLRSAERRGGRRLDKSLAL